MRRIPAAAVCVMGLAGLVVASSDPLSAVSYLAYAGAGIPLAIRRPRNPIGWLLILIGWGFAAVSVVGWAGYAAVVGLYLLTVLFPAGALPAGRWRATALAGAVLGIGVTLISAFAPSLSINPDGRPPILEWAILVPIGLFGIGAASMVVRYRRSSGIVRLQLRWLVSAVAFITVAVLVGLALTLVIGEDFAPAWIPAVVAFPTLPVAIAVAVMRYRLYEIDRIISRTIAWTIVSATVGGVFLVSLLVLQAVLVPVTGGNGIAVAASTLLAAAGFQQLRRPIQHAVDRRFHRSRYDAQRLLESFAMTLRNELDVLAVSEAVVGAAERSVQPVAASVWLRARSS